MSKHGLVSAALLLIFAMTGCGDDGQLPWEPETPVCLLAPHCEGVFVVEEDDYYDIHSRHDCTVPRCSEGVVTTCTGCSNGGCSGCETTTCPSAACNAAGDGCADAPAEGATEPAAAVERAAH